MPHVLAWFSHWELIVVAAVLLLLFGTRLPKVARSLGLGVSEFKKGLKNVQEDVQSAGSEEESEKSE